MPRNNKAFTLLELMIVIAIIGILAAVAIPAFQDKKARDAQTQVVFTKETSKYAAQELMNELYPNVEVSVSCSDATTCYANLGGDTANNLVLLQCSVRTTIKKPTCLIVER